MRNPTTRSLICFLTAITSVFALTGALPGQEALYDNTMIGFDREVFPDPGDSLAAQPFITDASGSVAYVSIPLRGIGNPITGDLQFSIWDDNGSGSPKSEVGALSSLDMAELTSLKRSYKVNGPVSGLAPETQYHFVLDVGDVSFSSSNRFALHTVRSDEGTNGAGRMAVTAPNWTPLHRLLGSGMNYLQMSVVAMSELAACDFDLDGTCGLADIDMLGTTIANGGEAGAFDLTGDGILDQSDLDRFLLEANRNNGDADFDGEVAFSDFLKLADGFGESDKKWSEGDFIVNGIVDFNDFLVLADNFGSSSQVAAAVPEPTCVSLVMFGIAGLIGFRRRR